MQKLRVFNLLCALLLFVPPAQSAALADAFDEATSAETHGQYREAIASYQKVIESASEANEVTWAARSKARIARLLVNKGQIKEAEPLYLQLLKLTPVQFKNDPELMVDLDDLAESYTLQSRKLPTAKNSAKESAKELAKASAKECLFHALALRLAVGPHHPNVNQSYRHIALYMLSQGDRAAAERFIKQSIELEKHCPPDKLYRLVQDQALLASIYMQGNEWLKADQVTREVLARTEKYPFLSWAWPQLHYTLGQCYSHRFQYAESDREYQLGLTLAKQYPNPNGDISPECLKGLKENAILKVKNKQMGKRPISRNARTA